MKINSARIHCCLFLASFACAFLASRLSAIAQEINKPAIANANVERRAIKTSLAQEVLSWAAAAAKRQWLAYAVPAVNAESHMCCNDGGWNNHTCGTCRLESSDHGANFNIRDDKVNLEAPQKIMVLLRAENNQLGKILVFSEDCTLDAGG